MAASPNLFRAHSVAKRVIGALMVPSTGVVDGTVSACQVSRGPS